jgi:hypothetical protein
MNAIDWIRLANDAVKVGDLVSADAGGMPIYRVVAVEGGQAVLQGELGAEIQKMALHRFHWKADLAH